MSQVYADQQVALSRAFVAGTIDSERYGVEFFEAQNLGADLDGLLDEALSELINDLLFALDSHSPFDDERRPDELDDEQLRSVVAQHLADYDAGRYEPGGG